MNIVLDLHNYRRSENEFYASTNDKTSLTL